MYRNHWLALLSMTLLLAAGCNPVDMATRGFKEVKGTGADIRTIRELPAAELAEYGQIRVGRVVSGIGDLVPPEFVVEVSSELRTHMGGLETGRAGTPLIVNGDITYYQTQGAASVLLGRTKMAIMHVTAVTRTGNKVADFLAIATSEALRTGDTEMATSLARGVANYFRQKLPD